MKSEYWRFLAWIAAAGLAAIVASAHRRKLGSTRAAPIADAGAVEQLVAFSIIAIGIFFRFYRLDDFFAGRLSSDENLLSVIYVSTVVNGEAAAHGASHLACALTLDVWYRLFGFTPYVARAYMATLGGIGLLFFFLGLRRMSGYRVALWSTAFLSISLQAVYFSKVAFETGWVLFVMPLLGYLLALAVQRRSISWAAAAGSVFSLGIFSYPGFILAVLAIFLGFVLALSFGSLQFRAGFRQALRSWRLGAAFVAGAIPFVAFALHRHATVLGASQPLLFGGGGLSLTLGAAVAGWDSLMRDLLIEGSSWYLLFPGMAFLEIALTPLAAYGLLMQYRRSASTLWLAIALSVPICIALVPFTGAYPGMRRAIYVTMPYAVAVGCGAVFLLDALQQGYDRHSLASRLAVMLSYGVLAIAILHPIAYQATGGRKATAWNPGEGYGNPRIPDEFLLSGLKTKNLLLERREFSGYFDDRLYLHYPRLYARYSADAGIVHRVELTPPLDAMSPGELALRAGWRFATWDARVMARYAANGLVCIPLEALSAVDGRNPYWGAISQTPGACPPDSFIPGHPGASVSLKFDRATRLRHGLHCDGPHCGADRPDFVYTAGGEVQFMLTPPEPQSPLVLRLDVAIVSADRESLVYVNNVFVGALTQAGLDSSQRFAEFPVPAHARAAMGDWTIGIRPTPDAGKQGWDLTGAELRVKEG